MKQVNTVIFTKKGTGLVLKRFDYPTDKIPNKYYWEKIKQEELTKLLRARDLEPHEVKVSDHSGQVVSN
jgi:hypothetical protein